jgi:tRNA nucleotidyltransferase (CCA-adding enzyme)
MHMRPQPCQDSIVPGFVAGGEARRQALAVLWQRLAPASWPLPSAALPGGSALVGGAVRDALLGRLAPQPDLDLVVPAEAIALGRRLAREHGGSCVVLDAERDMARLVLAGWTLDLARCEGGELGRDLLRRDYTANALALPLAPGSDLLDPTGGLADLAAGRLVAVAEANLLADPLRLLRGLRLSTELGLPLELRTRHWIERHAPRLAAVASERVLAEVEKLACSPRGHGGLRQLLQSDLLAPWLSAEAAPLPVLAELDGARAEACGLTTAEWAWALPLARLTALLDAAALARLRSSRQLQQRVARLRQGWMLLAGRPLEALSEAERFALQRSLEAELPALLLLLGPAPAHHQLLQRWRNAGDPLCHPRPPLDGRRLQQQLGLGAGPQLGRLLEHLSRERAFGRLPAQQGEPEALAAAQAWLQQADQHGDSAGQ